MKTNSTHLFSHSKPYALLRGITSFYHSLYYEEICVKNLENIPPNEPVIFTPNHQNALMDALAIIYSTKKQPVFMARADIFKKDTVKKILHFLKIVPVYRIRDGIESLSNNDSSFEQAFQVLKHNGAVGIMPEGNHGDQHRLRPLKKGAFRLAIQSQELLGKTSSVKIVPVGLEFSNYQQFRSKLLIIYGKPIDVKDYLEEYSSNAAKGLQSFRNRVADEMKAVMINIDSDEFYNTIYDAKELFSYHHRDTYNNVYEKFLLEKDLSDKLVRMSANTPEELNFLKQSVTNLHEDCKKLKIEPWVLSWRAPKGIASWISNITRFLFFLPFFAFATIFHAIPYLVSEIYSNRAKDKQFVSSMRFVVSFIMYLVWYILVLVMPVSIIFKVIAVVAMPVLGAISYDYWDSLKRALVKFRFILLKIQKNTALESLQKANNNIILWLTEKTRNYEN